MCSVSKLILLAIGQRDEVLGQQIVTLFRKPADLEDGGLVPQRTFLPELDGVFLGGASNSVY